MHEQTPGIPDFTTPSPSHNPQDEAVLVYSQLLEERRLARTDSLTGIYNRRWLEEALDGLAVERQGDFALAFIDLDDLKTINDQKGHEAGNVLLIQAADALQRCLSAMESAERPVKGQLAHAAVRLAGDEYVLLIHGISSQRQLGPLMDDALECLARERIGASIGGRPHRPGESGKELLAAVDALMYEHKQRRKQAKFEALPARKRLAAQVGRRLLRYAGMNPPRQP